MIYDEVFIGFERIEGLEDAFPADVFKRDALPYEAVFPDGKCVRKYRQRGGKGNYPFPEFYL